MTRYYLGVLVIFLGTCSGTHSQNTQFSALTKLPKNTEISIGIFNNGLIEKYGFILKNGELQPINNSHKLFEIGSITKVFTTLSALKILNRKGIAIDRSITSFAPELTAPAVTPITFQHLMTHTAGFPKMPNNFIWSVLKRPGDPFLHYTEKQMFSYLNKQFTPKTIGTFQYSNLGMGLLAYLVSNIAQKSLANIYSQEVFLPLEMPHSSLGIQEKQYKLVASKKNGKGLPKNTWQFSAVTAGAGALYSNIDDLSLFLTTVIHRNSSDTILNQSLSQMEMLQYQIDTTSAMGLGWRMQLGIPNIFYHGGITYGFKSLLAFNHDTQQGIIILTNAKGLSRKENTILKEVCFNYIINKAIN